MNLPNAEECVISHIGSLQNALHCVTQAKPRHDGWSVGADHAVTFQHDSEVTLRRSDHRSSLRFALSQGYRITRDLDADQVQRFRLTATHYDYGIMANDGREIVVFHWHPERGGVTWPHLHVGSLMIDSTRHDIGRRFSGLHLPTSRISIEQVVRALITQFDVTPLRANWQSILDEGDVAFKQTRTWA